MSFEGERDLTHRIVLINGASDYSIGGTLAEQLAKRGATLILFSRNKDGSLDKFAESLRQSTGNQKINSYGLDISDVGQVKETFKKIEDTYSHLDVVVNNAAMMPGYGKLMDQVSDELDQACFRTNVEGYWWVTKYSLPLLFKAPEGFERTIIFVSAVVGYPDFQDPVGMIGYSVSKAANINMAIRMHQHYVVETDKAKQIRGDKKLHRIVAIHPGIIATGLGRETWAVSDPHQVAKVEGKHSYFYRSRKWD
eukprot:TRINITY_DN2760_c0_g1_i1.p1 TRINITY_DN2760_c0_g1~~TRINITY_DN2760_c0_g1_i1.p1  ORF type:complete len:252 (-),score=49.33 TRINITY_DN2760_c0_g1_i1:184-939(-)